MTGKSPPLIIILGPTGVGKTELAIALAQQLNGEIIGADSRQIYRYLDIGTAKPTAEQRAAVAHHLIDFVEPDYNLSLAEYQEQAYQSIDELHNRGKLPFLVGGSGQYITARSKRAGRSRVCHPIMICAPSWKLSSPKTHPRHCMINCGWSIPFLPGASIPIILVA